MPKRVRLLTAILFLFVPLLAWADPPITLVRVLKGDHTLQLLAEGRVVREFNVALGANPKGHKMQAGDERPPEGVYRLDYKNPGSAFYKAIHISYPNARDVASAKSRGVSPGGQIMIHGQKNGLEWLALLSQRFDWTNGCIALANEDMDIVWERVKVGTPIEILP
jgi:murein L,D-transpeptidase YafK